MTAPSTRLCVLGGSLLVLFLIYSATSASFLHEWARDPLGHGYLVLPGALYLVWTRRDQLRVVNISKPAFWWLPILAGLAFVWLVANITATTAVQQFCLAFMVIGFVWGTLGNQTARELALPLGFLLFAVPVGDYLVPSLQRATAAFAVKLLQVSGVPVLLNREIISIPGSTWEVANACSGINYLMSALVMAYLYAGLAYKSPVRRLIFFLSAVPVALLANGLRVYITIFLAASGATEFAAGMRHYVVGWIVFGIILGVLFIVGSRFDEKSTGPIHSAGSGADVSAPVAAVTWWSTAAFVVAGLTIVAVAPLSAARIVSHGPNRGETEPPTSIRVLSPWESTPRQDLPEWVPQETGADATFDHTYRDGRNSVRIYVAYYGARNKDVEIGSHGRPVGSDGWTLGPAATRTVDVRGRTFEANQISLASASTSILLWRWYVIDGVSTSRNYVAKLLLARSRLTGRNRSSAAITIATESAAGRNSEAILANFLEHLKID